MSEVKAIEYLYEYPLSWKELAVLSDDQKAAFSVACFAVSEVNALMKLYVFSEHSLMGKDAIDCGALIQSHVILRTWSAKLFEFSEFITFKDKSNRTTDKKILSLSASGMKEFAKLTSLEGYSAARNLRHETSNHYLLDPVRKNLKYVSDKANCTMYLHEQNGNSFYPMGEEVLFAGRLNRQGQIDESLEDRRRLYQAWMKWNLEATTWLHGVYVEFFKLLIAENFAEKSLRKVDYWIDQRMVGRPKEVKVPIFMRRESVP